jgi:hypothetical protein
MPLSSVVPWKKSQDYARIATDAYSFVTDQGPTCGGSDSVIQRENREPTIGPS